jgi:hypothetical protein
MITRRRCGYAGLAILCGVLMWGAFASEPATALQVQVVPNAASLRFELIGNEPIAAPDGYSHVAGWSVLMFRDRKSSRCYVAFRHENAISVEEAAACPESSR